ncbi:MAG: hypothetical protein GY765_04595 [bacterium]|nr:hypothetical protein [bacterium]
MNPFEPGFVSTEGFHSVMDKRIARKVSRKVQGEERSFFYNPMWGRLGDESAGPPGTYYYSDSQYVCYFWNTFDQVLLRPGLVDLFSNDCLKVITEINGTSLIRENGTPNKSITSDHLPLLFRLNIETEA